MMTVVQDKDIIFSMIGCNLHDLQNMMLDEWWPTKYLEKYFEFILGLPVCSQLNSDIYYAWCAKYD